MVEKLEDNVFLDPLSRLGNLRDNVNRVNSWECSVIVHHLTVHHLTPDDAAAVRDISERVYAGINSSWSESSFLDLLAKFPDGQIAIKNHDQIVAFAFSLIVDYDKYGDDHTYDEITGDFTFETDSFDRNRVGDITE